MVYRKYFLIVHDQFLITPSKHQTAKCYENTVRVRNSAISRYCKVYREGNSSTVSVLGYGCKDSRLSLSAIMPSFFFNSNKPQIPYLQMTTHMHLIRVLKACK